MSNTITRVVGRRSRPFIVFASIAAVSKRARHAVRDATLSHPTRTNYINSEIGSGLLTKCAGRPEGV